MKKRHVTRQMLVKIKIKNNKPNLYILFSWATFSCHSRIRLCLPRVIFGGKHNQKTQSADFSRHRALLSIVKYVVCDIHSIQTRHNVILLC